MGRVFLYDKLYCYYYHMFGPLDIFIYEQWCIFATFTSEVTD